MHLACKRSTTDPSIDLQGVHAKPVGNKTAKTATVVHSLASSSNSCFLPPRSRSDGSDNVVIPYAPSTLIPHPATQRNRYPHFDSTHSLGPCFDIDVTAPS